MIKKGDLYWPEAGGKKRAWLNSKVFMPRPKNPVKFWGNIAKELVWRKNGKKSMLIRRRACAGFRAQN